MKKYTITKEEKLPHSAMQIEGTIDAATIETFRKHALEHLNEEVSMPGFRKGHIPESILVKKVGELFVLEEMANLALQEVVPEIIDEKNIDVLGRPEVKITKIAPSNPVEFSVKFELLPTVSLPDYKKIAKEKNGKKETQPFTVEEKEIDTVVEQIRNNFSEGKGDEKKLPEVTADFVQKLGGFKDVADFRNRIKENLLKEKEYRAKEKNRLEIVEAIIEKSAIDVPEVLIEGELDRMEAEFKNDLARMGMKFDDYLLHVKKKIEDVRSDWRGDAAKRVKFQLIIGKIAREEKIAPPKDLVEKEVGHLREHHKDADPDRVRGYIEHLLTNEEVFKFLETL